MTFLVTLIVTERWKVGFFCSETEGCKVGMNKKNAKGFTYHFTSLNCMFLRCVLNIFLSTANYLEWYLDCNMSHSCKDADIWLIRYYLRNIIFLLSVSSCILTSSFRNPLRPDICHCTILARVAIISVNSVY